MRNPPPGGPSVPPGLLEGYDWRAPEGGGAGGAGEPADWQSIAREREQLLICRKDSLRFVEFVRGKYDVHNHRYIAMLVDGMTTLEKNLLLEGDFEHIQRRVWVQDVPATSAWMGTQSFAHRPVAKTHVVLPNEQRQGKAKYMAILGGTNDIHTGNRRTLREIVHASTTEWTEPEWGFPKGRRNVGETDVETAYREFQEETGIDRRHVRLLKNLAPIDELQRGINGRVQRHRQYLGVLVDDQIPELSVRNAEQAKEVSGLGFQSYDEAMRRIRSTNEEKRRVLREIEGFFSMELELIR